MRKHTEKIIFIMYLVGFIVLALSVVFFQPLANTPPLFGNPPDEHARYLIPKYICEHGVLPTGLEEEVRIPAYGFSYGLYNVFPYIIQGYVMRFVNLFADSEVTLLYSARMVNVVFGALMAVVVYLIGKKVFADRRFRWIFCFGVMYLPQNLFMHTYINTDSCCMLSTAMMVYALITCYQEGINRKNSLWMSGGIILCALSYYNAYGYILSCILLFIAYFFQRKDGRVLFDWKGMLRWGVFISAVVLLGIGWWFIRSFIVLDGDMLGLATREKMASMYAVESVNPLYMSTYQSKGYTLWQMFKENDTFEGAFESFVATYGSMSIRASIWLYRAYKVFFGMGILGVLYYLFNRKNRFVIKGKKLFFHLNMLFCMLMPLILMIYYAYTMDYQHQGRYILPALVPLMYYMVKGIEKIAGLRFKQLTIPKGLVNVGVTACFLLIILGTVYMVYFCAMPIYLQTGVVL